MDPMNILNVILIFISPLDCAEYNVSVKRGFLCQGEIRNLPSKIEKVTGHLLDSSVNLFQNDEIVPSFFKVTQNDERLLYNYISFCDNECWWIYKLDNLLFYNEFEFKIDGLNTIMLDISYMERGQQKKTISKRFFESTVSNLVRHFMTFINEFLFEYAFNFKRLDDDYKALVPQTDDQDSHENGEFSARKFILDQLDSIKKYDNRTRQEKRKSYGELLKNYSIENLEKLISGEKDKSPEDYSEEELRLYTKRGFDIIKECGIFQQTKNIKRYIFPEQGTTSMSYRKVLIFEFNFRAILNHYEDKNPKKEVIKPEDLVFYDKQGSVVKISHDDIFILSYEDPIYSYVAVDLEALKRLKVVKLTCGKLVKTPKYFENRY